MRKGLTEAVEKIVADELIAANAAFPAFNSRHEGYAVILEELEETHAAYNETRALVERIWWLTKHNSKKPEFEKLVKDTTEAAKEMAAEAIQTAAMLQKLLDYISSAES